MTPTPLQTDDEMREMARVVYFGKDDSGVPNYMSESEIDWWLQVLHSERKALAGEIEGMKKEIIPLAYFDVHNSKEFYEMQYHEQTLRIGYNKALSDVLSLLENLNKTR